MALAFPCATCIGVGLAKEEAEAATGVAAAGAPTAAAASGYAGVGLIVADAECTLRIDRAGEEPTPFAPAPALAGPRDAVDDISIDDIDIVEAAPTAALAGRTGDPPAMNAEVGREFHVLVPPCEEALLPCPR